MDDAVRVLAAPALRPFVRAVIVGTDDDPRLADDVDRVLLEPGHGPEGAFRVGHIGLASARERVEVLGGTLTITSAPGRGTRITAAVPSEGVADPDREPAGRPA